MAIQRIDAQDTEAVFMVNINLIAKGSKKMNPDEQEALMAAQPDAVRILVTSEDGSLVLVDEVKGAKEFATRSVGYGLQIRAQFVPAE